MTVRNNQERLPEILREMGDDAVIAALCQQADADLSSCLSRLTDGGASHCEKMHAFHEIKGLALTLQQDRLAALCAQGEALCRDGTLPRHSDTLLADVTEACADLRAALAAWSGAGCQT